MSKVFLGGTCNDFTWRDKLIPFLEKQGIEYFNPDGRADSWVPSISDVFANDWEVAYD